ncbi:Rieske 2Fe-2S domain-containing protein [Sphingomonas canadensis]|uniref:Rieske 2Fe-2S domain-containing protein n=1 Tax=Sphingomonas canadensis TaxID=1219257 RepID=A0ABW3HBG8_9SPHN|nr:aromatic ring-hydroxylating dioxygenase subunit alpha [Sphingomonas canadensis]MCW3838289.1 aromatic ring-hydroxylating dioxygenase subunit alpha [Sphingomonas canadensis]
MSYLRNCWYAAGWSQDIGDKPMARQFLGEHVVLYRTADGTPHALEDRCPHRFAPLSMGTLIDDQIQCPYHGLRFGTGGECVYNPHYAALPKAAKVASYPLLERYGMVWIWMGDEPADADKLPADFAFLTAPGFKAVSGYLRVEANYMLVVDNLLDLTHAPYLHPAFAIPGMTVEERLARTTTELERRPERVIARRWRKSCPPNGPTRSLFGFTDPLMDSRSHMHWLPPSLIFFDAGAARLDEAEELGLCLPAMHAITPETERSCHYFFAQGRNMLLDDPVADETLFGILDNAFRNEDEPMIEAQQARMGAETDVLALDPVLLKSDGAPVAARRALAALIAAEQAR